MGTDGRVLRTGRVLDHKLECNPEGISPMPGMPNMGGMAGQDEHRLHLSMFRMETQQIETHRIGTVDSCFYTFSAALTRDIGSQVDVAQDAVDVALHVPAASLLHPVMEDQTV